MRARGAQRRARLFVALMLGAGMLFGCHGDEGATYMPEAGVRAERGEQGHDREELGDQAEDPNSIEVICREDPELAGCPWDEDVYNTAPEGVWGNSIPTRCR